jgi:hypothetical protein
MPYHVVSANGQYCVFKDDEPEAMQCYQSMDKALAYLTALNIATSDETKATYIAPQAVADNAQRALDVRAEKPPSQQGMTLVGLARANQLANREPVSFETVRRMVAYFDRHEIDKEGATWSEQGKGWQAWYGWGGDEGRAWARRIVEENSMATKASRRHSESDMEGLRMAAYHNRETMKALRTVGYDGMKPKSATKAIDESTILNERQLAMYDTYESIVEMYGVFDKGIGANGAHYIGAEGNPFVAEGMACTNCVFYLANRCEIVEGDIEADALCKLWIIPESALIAEAPAEAEAEEETEEMAEEIAEEAVAEVEEPVEEAVASAHMDDEDKALDNTATMNEEATKRFARRLLGVK